LAQQLPKPLPPSTMVDDSSSDSSLDDDDWDDDDDDDDYSEASSVGSPVSENARLSDAELLDCIVQNSATLAQRILAQTRQAEYMRKAREALCRNYLEALKCHNDDKD
jgi:hypothetical protein